MVADNPGASVDPAWNYFPTPDVSIEEASNAMDVVGEVDQRILAMAIRGVDITEVYSPERVAKTCSRFGLSPGSSMDLTNGYDFDTEADRSRAERIIDEEKPMLVIGSPPCTFFSVLQELNKWLNKDS